MYPTRSWYRISLGLTYITAFAEISSPAYSQQKNVTLLSSPQFSEQAAIDAWNQVHTTPVIYSLVYVNDPRFDGYTLIVSNKRLINDNFGIAAPGSLKAAWYISPIDSGDQYGDIDYAFETSRTVQSSRSEAVSYYIFSYALLSPTQTALSDNIKAQKNYFLRSICSIATVVTFLGKHPEIAIKNPNIASIESDGGANFTSYPFASFVMNMDKRCP